MTCHAAHRAERGRDVAPARRAPRPAAPCRTRPRARARRARAPSSISTTRCRRGRRTRAPVDCLRGADDDLRRRAASVTLTPGASVFMRPPAPAASRPPRRGTRSSSRRFGTRRCRGSRSRTSRVVGTPPISSSRSARRARSIARCAAVVADDQLRDQRVVVRRDHASPPRRTCRRARRGRAAARKRVELPGRRAEVVTRILGVDAHLDRVARARRAAAVLERLAGRDPDLRADEVERGDELGHRMLDLQARVQLDERERAVGADEELERARVAVADVRGTRARRPSSIASRCSGSSAGDGDSSISF